MDILQANQKFQQLKEVHESTISARDKASVTAESFVHMMHYEMARGLTGAEDFEDILECQRRGLSSFLAAALAARVFDNRDVAALISMLDPASKLLGYESHEVWNLAMRIGQLFDPKNQQ